MTWSNTRGRPRDLPEDNTPLRGARVDARARVAWLLRVSRMASPDGGTGRDFVGRLGRAGYDVGVSALSRREHGQEDIPGEMISAYESALGMPPGHLRSVCDSLRRAAGTMSIRGEVHFTRLEVAELLARVEARIADGEMSSGDWLTLSHALVQSGGAILPPSLQRDWSTALLVELLRSVGGAYMARFEALARLMSDDVTRGHVVNAVMRVIDNPAAGCYYDALSILGESSDPLVIGILTDLMVSRRGAVRYGAALALMQPIVLGTPTADQARRVERAILKVVRDDPQDGGDAAFMLAQRMSLPLTRTVIQQLGRNPGKKPIGAYIQDPARLGEYLERARKASGLHQDRMLERLLREALTDDFRERRHHAGLMLMSSPYRDAVADCAFDIVQADPGSVAGEAAGTLLSYVVTPAHRDRLARMLAGDDESLQALALACAGHAGGVADSVDLGRYLRHPRLARAATYAAGMSGHPALDQIDTMTGVDPDIRAYAMWWRSIGPAIYESSRSAEPQDARRTGRRTAERRRVAPVTDGALPDIDPLPIPANVASLEQRRKEG